MVTARYDADKQRWRELRVIAETEAARGRARGRNDGHRQPHYRPDRHQE